MGEMANLTIEQGMDQEDWDYEHPDEIVSEDIDLNTRTKSSKTLACRYCNKSPLKWNQVDGRWIVSELDGSIHNCPNCKLSISASTSFLLRKILVED